MRRLLLLLVTLSGLLAAGATLAQPAEPSPEELRALAELLRDPGIQSWLQAHAEGRPVGAQQATTAASQPESAQQVIADRLDAMRGFLRELAVAAPTLPDELSRALTILYVESQERGLLSVVVLLAAFAALGFGLEWL